MISPSLLALNQSNQTSAAIVFRTRGGGETRSLWILHLLHSANPCFNWSSYLECKLAKHSVASGGSDQVPTINQLCVIDSHGILSDPHVGFVDEEPAGIEPPKRAEGDVGF